MDGHTQCGDVISQMFFIFRKEKRLKCGVMRTIKLYPLAKLLMIGSESQSGSTVFVC